MGVGERGVGVGGGGEILPILGSKNGLLGIHQQEMLRCGRGSNPVTRVDNRVHCVILSIFRHLCQCVCSMYRSISALYHDGNSRYV